MVKHKPIVTKKGTELPLTDMKGKPYLQVAYRLVWFREEHPDWSIKTYLAERTNDYALAEAEILDAEGRLIASDRKFVTQKSFQSYIEKATTGAIGRALALCGYGTQFDPEEFDDVTEVEHMVDSPVARPKVWKLGDREIKEIDDALKLLGQTREYAKARAHEFFKKPVQSMNETEYFQLLNSLIAEGAMK